jgi:BRCA1-associated protein
VLSPAPDGVDAHSYDASRQYSSAEECCLSNATISAAPSASSIDEKGLPVRSTSQPLPPSSSAPVRTSCKDATAGTSAEFNLSDVWYCLICGFTGCGNRHQGHMQEHYEQTLHTYALNADSKQVWDFASDGFVHKLLMGADSLESLKCGGGDGSGGYGGFEDQYGSPAYGGGIDIFAGSEVSSGGLFADGVDAIVSGKLEAAARHYNQVLAWQMEQNRMLYETRLQRIRSSMHHKQQQAQAQGNAKQSQSGAKAASQTLGRNSSASASVSTTTWRDNMIASLHNEKIKLIKQMDGAKERLRRAETELGVLGALQHGLESNSAEWARREDIAETSLREAERIQR